MARRRDDTPTLDDLVDMLAIVPPWVGPLLAGFVFVLLRFVFPHFIFTSSGNNPGDAVLHQFMRPLFGLLAWLAPAVILMAWAGAELGKWQRRRLFERQTGLGSIRNLSWAEFEELVAEAYRRQGYQAEVTGNDAGDGGVDVVLERLGERVLVQCKHWRIFKVGVKPVRELLGVVTRERATRGVLVTSGRFTQEAVAFARRSPIELVDGPRLEELLKEVQQRAKADVAAGMRSVQRRTQAGAATATGKAAPECPECGTVMVLRIARRGQHAGSQFWACPRFPACRGKEALG